MIIKTPEQHMAFLQSRLPENNPARADDPQARLFDLIMNKKLATAPPSTVPTISSPLPAGILLGKENLMETSQGKQDNADIQNNEAPRSKSSIRMPISQDTPRIASNEIRQKIDFQSRPDLPDTASKNNSAAKNLELILPGVNHNNRLIGDIAAALNSRPDSSHGFHKAAVQSRIIPEHPAMTAQTSVNAPDSQITMEKLISSAAPFREHDLSRNNPAPDKADALPVKNRTSDHRHIQPGLLAARFESANRSGAIGYDRRGGTCYGIYQLSSRMGTMGEFLEFLDKKAPDISQRLRQAGPANSGGRTGAMPDEWKRIDSEQHQRFVNLQHDFIYSSFYVPAARGVESRTGLDMEAASPALREVLWSTAVQHGVYGAMSIFQNAAQSIDLENTAHDDREIIQAVYQERRTRFTGSTKAVQTAVQNRFTEEMEMALAMLRSPYDTHA